MKDRNLLLVAGIVGVIVVILAILFTVKRFGSSYSQGLANILPKPPEAPQTREKKRIRRITIKKDDGGGCLELTPDGVVRAYSQCGETLTDVNRLIDPKNLLKLFDIASLVDSKKYQTQGGKFITLIIETENGTETLYIPIGDGGGGDEIIEIIDQIEEDLPQPTATPGFQSSPTPTLIGTTPPAPSLTPSPTLYPWITPSPTPIYEEPPFSCGFTEDPSSKKPYNVSNFICSTQPTPAPTPTP